MVRAIHGATDPRHLVESAANIRYLAQEFADPD
jgi:hypothetical protein